MRILSLLFGLFVSVSCATSPDPPLPSAGHAERADRNNDAGGNKRLFSSSQPSGNAFTITHFAREIVLTPAKPSDADLDISLLEITYTGRVFIRVDEAGEVVSATAGKPFLTKRTEPYGVPRFGETGLVVKEVDVANSTAVLEARWAD